jgi:hypothetical protein
VVGEEKLYWDEPEILLANINDVNSLKTDQLVLLDSIARLLSNPDGNLAQLKEIYYSNPFLHPTGLRFDNWYEMRTGKSIEEFEKEFK